MFVPVVAVRSMYVCLALAFVDIVAMAVPAGSISPVLGLEGRVHFMHDQVHGAQHFGQHVVGLDLKEVRLECISL